MNYEENLMKLKYYLSEYTTHFDEDAIALFIYKHLGNTSVDSQLKKSMRKYDVLLEEVSDILKKYFSDAKGVEKKDISVKDIKVFIGLSALENGVISLLNSGYDIVMVSKIIATYLKTVNFNVIPDEKIKESFSNVGKQLMREAMMLEGAYRVSDYVVKTNNKLVESRKENKNRK